MGRLISRVPVQDMNGIKTFKSFMPFNCLRLFYFLQQPAKKIKGSPDRAYAEMLVGGMDII